MAASVRLTAGRRLFPWTRGTSSYDPVVLSLTAPASTMAETTTSTHAHPRPFSAIPGPKSWPLLGCMPSVLTDPAFDGTRMPRLWESYFRRYGPIFKMDIAGLGSIVFISDPLDIERLYRETFDNPVRPFFFSLKKVREINRAKYFKTNETGILTEHGEEWWRVRSRVQVHSMKPRTVAQYLLQMDRVAQEFIVRCAGQRNDNNELPEEFLQELYKWALESLCLVTLGRRVGCLEDSAEGMKIINASIAMIHTLSECEHGFQWWRYVTTPTMRRMREAHETLLEVSMDAVHQAQSALKARAPEDDTELNIMDSLITTPGLNTSDVVTFLVDLLLAGVDTTSVSVLFTMYNLACHPDKQTKMQSELDQVLGDGCHLLTEKHLAKLTYTKACVRESLRLYPTTSLVSRQANQDMTLHGYAIPRGTIVNVSMSQSGKNEEYFPRAEEFLPERWLRDDPRRPTNPYASVPFSMGTRMCVGRRLAEQEIYTLLARMMSVDVS
ncbi:probable cytochrome P450 49a1 [Panulirus ornatus]|uniref:probable cytochrome P450 49a1 n=1 Tax=Panulirus ornatus TaxID=150431 RepID=UPI003A862D9D